MFAGALGTGTRYLVGLWAAKRLGTTFPYATLIVNVAGCFLIALLLEFSLTRANIPATLKLALATGYLGGLTTYSSFNYESSRLLFAGAHTTALLNVTLTLGACFIAGVIGTALARALPP
jgi:fluoride exporter